jgi:KilA-N domain
MLLGFVSDTTYQKLASSLTYCNPADAASQVTRQQNWMQNRNTIELLGFWEQMYNQDFKPLEFEGFRKQAGLNSFVMTPRRWIESTNAIGITSTPGLYGGAGCI